MMFHYIPNNKSYIFVIICFALSFSGCAPASLTKRVNSLEASLLANDKNLKSEIAKIYSETQQELSKNRQKVTRIENAVVELKADVASIENKTDKFCVYMKNETSIQIFAAGQCPE